MSIWHHPHNLTLVKKLQFNYKIHLCISWPIQAMSETCHGVFFQALSAVLCCTLLPPVFLSPSPASCVIKPD